MSTDNDATRGAYPQGPAPNRGGGDGQPATAAQPAAFDLAAVRHPTEPSRFALALFSCTVVVAVALFVFVSLGRAADLAGVMLGLALVILLVWVLLQVWRVRLLADAVQVSPETLPGVHDVVDEVRTRLAYDKRVDVFVVSKVSRVLGGDAEAISLTSFFGVKVIVIEGGSIGDLAKQGDRDQLVFLLATFFGALKARQAQWAPVLLALQMTRITAVVFPLIYPWYRATVYTGDRIAYTCCGDLQVSLQAVYRVLVGKEVAPHLRASGLAGQALDVRRNLVLRLAQLLRSAPYATNRYLELLAFAQDREPAAYETHRASLAGRAAEVSALVERLRRRRPITVAAPLSVGICAVILLGGLLMGLNAPNSSVAGGLWSVVSPTTDGDGTTTPSDSGSGGTGSGSGTPSHSSSGTPSHSSSDSSSDSSSGTPSNADLALFGMLPTDLLGNCSPSSADSSRGEVAVLDCGVPGPSVPDQIRFTQYADAASMQSAFDELAGSLPADGCTATSGNARDTWQSSGITRGPIACYETKGNQNAILWGQTDVRVLAFASDPSMTTGDMYGWWVAHAMLTR